MQAKNLRLKEALVVAVETAELLKSQRNKYCEKFGYLTHIEDSL